MTSQLQQVALTYITRRGLWLFAAVAGFGFGPMLLMSIFSSRRLDGSQGIPIIGMAAAVIGFTVVTQAKWQFCNPRARLLPGFARPHRTAILALLLLGCGAYPLCLALREHWSVLGVPAASIAIAASIIWALHRPHWLPGVTGMATFLSLITEQGIMFWIKAEHARLYAPAHIGILIAAWVAIAYWIRRLQDVREEDADYVIPIQAQQGAASRLERTQASRALGQQFTRNTWRSLPSDWWHNRLATMHATTTRARQRLLRYGLTPAPLWINAVSMALAFFIMMGMISRLGINKSADPSSNLSTLWMMIVMPGMIIGGTFAMRRARMAQELLYPLRRSDYLAGLFRVAALNAVIVWMTTFIAMWALIAWIMPDYLFPGFIAPLAALSISVQIYAFGVMIGVARTNSGTIRIVASMFVVLPAMFALMLSTYNLPRPAKTAAEREQLVQQQYADTYANVDAHIDPETRKQLMDSVRRNVHRQVDGRPARTYVPWVASGVLTAIGLAAFLDARKRWLNLELG